jgi:hypothetical protein
MTSLMMHGPVPSLVAPAFDISAKPTISIMDTGEEVDTYNIYDGLNRSDPEDSGKPGNIISSRRRNPNRDGGSGSVLHESILIYINSCRDRSNARDPTFPQNDTTCIAVSQYLYSDDDSDIQPNPEIYGIDVRYSIYAQSLFNHFEVALFHSTGEEFVVVNAINALVLSTFWISSASFNALTGCI